VHSRSVLRAAALPWICEPVARRDEHSGSPTSQSRAPPSVAFGNSSGQNARVTIACAASEDQISLPDSHACVPAPPLPAYSRASAGVSRVHAPSAVLTTPGRVGRGAHLSVVQPLRLEQTSVDARRPTAREPRVRLPAETGQPVISRLAIAPLKPADCARQVVAAPVGVSRGTGAVGHRIGLHAASLRPKVPMRVRVTAWWRQCDARTARGRTSAKPIRRLGPGRTWARCHRRPVVALAVRPANDCAMLASAGSSRPSRLPASRR
jgi:hypothetical protein